MKTVDYRMSLSRQSPRIGHDHRMNFTTDSKKVIRVLKLSLSVKIQKLTIIGGANIGGIEEHNLIIYLLSPV